MKYKKISAEQKQKNKMDRLYEIYKEKYEEKKLKLELKGYSMAEEMFKRSRFENEYLKYQEIKGVKQNITRKIIQDQSTYLDQGQVDEIYKTLRDNTNILAEYDYEKLSKNDIKYLNLSGTSEYYNMLNDLYKQKKDELIKLGFIEASSMASKWISQTFYGSPE